MPNIDAQYPAFHLVESCFFILSTKYLKLLPGTGFDKTEEKRAWVFQSASEFWVCLRSDKEFMVWKLPEFHQLRAVKPVVMSGKNKSRFFQLFNVFRIDFVPVPVPFEYNVTAVWRSYPECFALGLQSQQFFYVFFGPSGSCIKIKNFCPVFQYSRVRPESHCPTVLALRHQFFLRGQYVYY